MKKLKKLLALTMATTLLGTGLVGCGTATQASQEVVAVVDGVEVTEGLYRTYLWSAQQLLEQISGPSIWDMELEGRSTQEWAKENALESVTLAIVTEKLAKEMNLEVTKEQEDFAKENAKNFKEVNSAVLETYGFTEKEVEEVLLAAELSELVKQKIMENYEPTEEDIQKFVDENKESYETVTAKHVLIQTVDPMTGQPLPEEEVVKAEELANDILERAKAGEDMATLAAEYSEDPGSKDNGGEYTFPRGQMVQEFEDAAFNGKDGEVWPELVKTTYGYHIVKTESHNAADEAVMREEFAEYEKMNFMNAEMMSMIEGATVEKTAAYDGITIIRTDVPATEEEAPVTGEEVPAEDTTTDDASAEEAKEAEDTTQN